MRIGTIAAGLALLVASEGVAQTHVQVLTLPPRAEDVSTIDGMIKAYYDVISGPAGKPREWGRDRTLYIPDLRFVAVSVDKAGKITPRIVDHQTYVDTSEAFFTKGFFEKEIHRVTQRFGPIAHVWSTYESRQKEDGPITMRGINSIELFWDGKRWWISNAIWTDETPEMAIPKEYLPGDK